MAEMSNLMRLAVRGALAWWLDELRGLLPDRLQRLWGRNQLILTYCDGELRQQGAGPQEAAAASTVARSRRRAPATLRLGPEQGLRTSLELPLAARDDLGRLLYFEMDRLTPFQADEVHFAHRITATDQERRRLVVAVHIAPSGLIEGARVAASRLGIEVNRVELVSADDGSEPALNLLPPAPAKRRSANRLNLLLTLLAVAAVIIPLEWQNLTATALERQVATMKVQADKSLALRERLQMMTVRQTLPIERKIEMPMITGLIAELTRLIPDQAYVTQLSIRDDALQVRGYAKAASELIGALARSELLHEPQFRSPLTRDPRKGLERFHISTRLGERNE